MIGKLSTKYSKLISFLMIFLFMYTGILPAYSFSKIISSFDSTSAGFSYLPVIEGMDKLQKKPAEPILTEFIPLVPEDNGGPSQPEMSSFKSVTDNEFVNLFTGDFSYNIPLLDVGGYPVNLFYNAGITPEQDAGWVGLGWNINPGTITRNMRGVPDDFNGTEERIQFQNTKPNINLGGSMSASFELFGIEGLAASVGFGISYNNSLGLAFETIAGISLNLLRTVEYEKETKEKATDTTTIFSVGMNANLNSRSGLTMSPSISSKLLGFNTRSETGIGISTSYNSRQGIRGLNINTNLTKMRGMQNSHLLSFNKPVYTPVLRMPMTHYNITASFRAGAGLFGSSPAFGINAFYNKSHISSHQVKQVKPMYGYMYLHKGIKDLNAVMDFTRFNDKEVTSVTPVISVPQYGYDIFSISGEGTGGTIRAYRKDFIYVKDNIVYSDDLSGDAGVDLGPPGHYGANFSLIATPTSSGEWVGGNKLRSLVNTEDNSGLEEFVYFKNPTETNVIEEGTYDHLGGTELVRFKLGGSNMNPTIEPVLEKYNRSGIKSSEIPFQNIANHERIKRTQLITMLTAEETVLAGLDSRIPVYNSVIPVNSNNKLNVILKERVVPEEGKLPNHISEINVLESDGRRYVYGLPVYNTIERDYTFTVESEPDGNELVNFSSNNIDPYRSFPGKEGYVLISETPAYAHSFLLTGLLSPDYVDVTGDGISEDDLGTAVKFNYTQIAGKYKWKTPFSSKAHSNPGLLSEKKDDKGIVSYGEREVWYMHSIESKSMIAIFTLENRKDAKGVTGVTGGINSSDQINKRLKKIDLYNKADISKNGIAEAKPVKTVWFHYDYSLIGNVPDNNGTSEIVNGQNVNLKKGRLTLKAISFTYNGQQRNNKEEYKFNYYNNEAQYVINSSDRWGNYKPHEENPQGLKNSIYPYSIQDKELADEYASLWNLSEIKLPSGGTINITYESDDYAYVQNRKATVMQSINKLANENGDQGNSLYTKSIAFNIENDIVYINVPQVCHSKEEVYEKYLDGIEQLAFKLSVNMPKGKEYITVYSKFIDYGYVSHQSQIWVKLQKYDGHSPLALTVLDFLRQNLPGQAFPGYDLDGSFLNQFKDMIAGMTDGLISAFKNPLEHFKSKGLAKTINLNESFVRLNEPSGIKRGGGYRVKSVVLSDQWNAMTGQYDSELGKLYDYTTKLNVNGDIKTISSGVASYEPSIGGEENPMQEILQFSNRMPLGPANYDAIEMPVLDAFFPAPLVGYSKITVKSIHADKRNSKGQRLRSETGIQVSEYYTAKDFPYIIDYTPIDHGADKSSNLASLVPFFVKWSQDNRAVTQGFRIILNDMHGKIKNQEAYSATDLSSPIQSSRYYYRNTGLAGMNEQFDFANYSESGKIISGNIGIDIELMTDVREFHSKMIDITYQVQAENVIPPIIWVPLVWATAGYGTSTYQAITTTKLINFRSILDSVVVTDKGSMVSTKNLIYDAETGSVLVSRTNNEFDLPVYQSSYPAYWAYSGMAPAYKNIHATFNNVNFADGRISNLPAGYLAKDIFESGDELLIYGGTAPTDDCLINFHSSDEIKIWVFDPEKNNSALYNPNPDFIFIDSDGRPFNRNNVSFKIIRSGKRNMLTTPLASFTSLQLPVVTEAGIKKFKLVNNAEIINATAYEYREKWQVDKGVIKRYDTIINHNLPGSDNLISNGDFEMGNTGFYSEYEYSPVFNTNGNAGNYTIENLTGSWMSNIQPVNSFPTDPGNFLIADGKPVIKDGMPTSSLVIWTATIPVIKNRRYQLNFKATSLNYPQATNIRILINGNQQGAVEGITPTVALWENVIREWNSSLQNYAQIIIMNTDHEWSGDSYFAIDDIEFKLLPEVIEGEFIVETCDGTLDHDINPYLTGLIGNYKPGKSLVFYGERNHGSLPIDNNVTKISKDGVLKDFVSYWDFNSSGEMKFTTDPKWTWTGEITRINKRGMELETKDILENYAAAQYGYGGNLPTAITKNARYHQAAFEGFEDKDYHENLGNKSILDCEEYDHIRLDRNKIVHAPTEGINAHTGKKMLKLSGGQSLSSIIDVNSIHDEYDLILRKDTLLMLHGNGGRLINNNLIPKNALNYVNPESLVAFHNGVGLDISFSAKDSVFTNHNGTQEYHHVIFETEQYFKIESQANYTFQISINDLSAVYNGSNWSRTLTAFLFNEQNIMVGTLSVQTDNDEETSSISINLPKGVYKIKAVVDQSKLRPYPGDFVYFPSQYIVSVNSGTNSYKFYDKNNNCYYHVPIPGKDELIHPGLVLTPEKEMLFSAWVRESCGIPCNKLQYEDALAELIFKDASDNVIGVPVQLRPSGPIIEGWQKVEGSFIPPAGSVKAELKLVNENSTDPLYIDDLRIHPFDANMRSFIYDPVNLRLIAELDENNYSRLYEYDEEGILIRTKAETIEGIKTINETRSARQKGSN